MGCHYNLRKEAREVGRKWDSVIVIAAEYCFNTQTGEMDCHVYIRRTFDEFLEPFNSFLTATENVLT